MADEPERVIKKQKIVSFACDLKIYKDKYNLQRNR